MDSFEFNKIAGALLATCLTVLVLNITAGVIFAPESPAKPGFEIAVAGKPEAGGKAATAGAGAAEEPIEKLLASASIERGEAAVKKCATCHTFDKGGPNRVGPNLWGVVGRAKGSVAGFAYSANMKGKGGEWTIEDLNIFLTNPKAFVAGTSMSFAGVPKGGERADILAFLNSKSDAPKPLPSAKAQ